jgi:hypothetical protein
VFKIYVNRVKNIDANKVKTEKMEKKKSSLDNVGDQSANNRQSEHQTSNTSSSKLSYKYKMNISQNKKKRKVKQKKKNTKSQKVAIAKTEDKKTENDVDFSESKFAVDENEPFAHLSNSNKPQHKRENKFNTTGDKNAHKHVRKHEKGMIK